MAWFTEWVLGQTKIHKETLSRKTKQQKKESKKERKKEKEEKTKEEERKKKKIAVSSNSIIHWNLKSSQAELEKRVSFMTGKTETLGGSQEDWL